MPITCRCIVRKRCSRAGRTAKPGQAPISRQNLSDWVGAATAQLEPLVKAMKRDLLATGYVVADETPICCNDPDLRDGKATTGWLWALSGPGGDVIFEWRLSR